MKQRAYEWDPRPPSARERIISGVFLAAYILAVANYYAGWRLFRGYDKWVLGVLFLALLFLLIRLPGVRRVHGVKRPLTYWLVLGVAVAVAIALALLDPKR